MKTGEEMSTEQEELKSVRDEQVRMILKRMRQIENLSWHRRVEDGVMRSVFKIGISDE